MKKFLASALITFCFASAFSQNNGHAYKPFKIYISDGLVFPQKYNLGNSFGFSLAVEPKYSLNDKISIGLRIEGTAVVNDVDQSYNSSYYSDNDVRLSSSFLGTADYYFTKKSFRPFVGAGAGIYANGKTIYPHLNDNYTEMYEIPSSAKFGGMLRAGFEVWHFRLALEYNSVSKTHFTPLNDSQNSPAEIKNSYFSIKTGLFIGGGKIKKRKSRASYKSFS